LAIASSFTASLSGGGSTEIKSNSILSIDLSIPMPDKTNNVESNPLSLDNQTFVGVVDAVKSLSNMPKPDDKIKGIYINPGSVCCCRVRLQ
jgi:hypothetical protein